VTGQAESACNAATKCLGVATAMTGGVFIATRHSVFVAHNMKANYAQVLLSSGAVGLLPAVENRLKTGS